MMEEDIQDIQSESDKRKQGISDDFLMPKEVSEEVKQALEVPEKVKQAFYDHAYKRILEIGPVDFSELN